MRTGSTPKVIAVVVLLAAATVAAAQEQKTKPDIKKAIAAAKVGLSQALDAAQKEVAGGKVIEAGLEVEKDATFYEIVVLSGDAVKEVKVDAASGKVLGVKDEKPEADEEKELAEARQAIAAAKVTFAQALETSAREVKDGKPFKIELELKDGKPMYHVALLQGEKVMIAVLDGVGGKVLKTAERQAKTEGEEGKGKEKEIAEAKAALAKARLTLVQALETAAKEGKGAKPFKIDLEIEDGQAIFDVELLDSGKAEGPEMEIDAVTGKVNKVESVEEQKREDAKEAKENAAKSQEEQREAKQKAAGAKALALAKVTLVDAVRTAEKEVKNSQAFAAILEIEDGKPMYDVKVMTGGTWKEVEVDAVTGKVLKVEDAEEEENEADEVAEHK